jgi:hypothetical protein
MDKIIENIQLNEYNNRKIVVSTKQGTPFRMQFPRMYMPFGVSGFTPEVGQIKYNIDFAIKGCEEDDSYMKKYYESIRKIEDMVIDSVTQQSEHIFGKPMTREEILPIYNSDKIIIKDAVSNGLYARNSGHAIVELNSVYFLNRMFGCTWKLYQLVVYEPQNLKGFQFIV